MSARVEVEADGRTVSLSSPAKQLVEGVTKHELVAHWQRVGPAAIDAVGGRLVSAKRAPDGPTGDVFFQKQVPSGMPAWVSTADVPKGDGGTTRHVVLADVAHLLALVQFGTVEVHVSSWGVEDPYRPRELVLDLDPPPDDDVERVRTALRWTVELLDEVGLPWRAKTTGSKGFHVHVPVEEVDQDVARDLAALLANTLVTRHGDALTTEFSKSDRAGRVLVDWWRNSGKATAIAPWSPRIAAGAPVAVPLSESEVRDDLGDVLPSGWHVADVEARLDDVGLGWPATGPTAGRAALRRALSRLA